MADKPKKTITSNDINDVARQVAKNLDDVSVNDSEVVVETITVTSGEVKPIVYDVHSVPSSEILSSGSSGNVVTGGTNTGDSTGSNTSSGNSDVSLPSGQNVSDNLGSNTEASLPEYAGSDGVSGQGVESPSGVPINNTNPQKTSPEGEGTKNDLPEKEGIDKPEEGSDGEEKKEKANGEDNSEEKKSSSEEDPDQKKGFQNQPNGENQDEVSSDKKNPSEKPKNGEDEIPPEGANNPNAQGRGLNNGYQQVPDRNNSTGMDSANRNMNHNKKVSEGKKSEDGASKPAADNNKKEKESSDKNKVQSKNVISKAKNAKDVMQHPFKSMGNALKNKLITFLLSNPMFIVFGIFIVLFLFLILIVVIDDSGGNGGNAASYGAGCNYEINGVLSTGTLNATSIQVELVNCDATQSNYTVLETVDFEKYVLGVALAEIGPSASDEALKAQIVAARNFALTRNRSMCPGNPDNCFYGYNPNTGKIRMRACENDQVYWDYNRDSYRQDRGAVSLYSPEINNGTLWKSALSAERKAEVLTIANEVKGVILLDESGSIINTPYNSSVSTNFMNLASEGKTYKDILQTQYGVSNYNDAVCSYDGEIFYGDYVLSSDGHTILHERLDNFLINKGTSIENFSNLISENVNTAGYGTRAGVVTAAVTLIGELGNYGVKLPYYWSGGHYDGVVVGALGYWGSSECHISANGQNYNYCGFDCSGFVPWAIKNGGFNMAQMLAGDFKNISGVEKVTLKSNLAVIQPGDLLESKEHIVLVIGVDEEKKQYICAEASGNQYGVWFTRRSFNEKGYWGVRMDGYYNNPSNIRSS